MRVTTESGSIYEIDPERKRIRRLNDKQGSSAYAGFDGAWRQYAELFVAEDLHIIWGWNETKGAYETTQTSPVTSIVLESDIA